MEQLLSIWLPLGIISALVMAIFEKDMRSIGMFTFMAILGPITLLIVLFVVLYSFISTSDSPKPKQKQKQKQKQKRVDTTVKKTQIESATEKFDLIQKIFSEKSSNLLKRSDIVNLQRFVNKYLENENYQKEIPKESVINILVVAVNSIDAIYDGDNIGESRRQSLLDSLSILDPSSSLDQNATSKNALNKSRKFGLTFDLESLVADLPGWTINEGYSDNDKILMISSDGAQMKLTCHRYDRYKTFKDSVEDVQSSIIPGDGLNEIKSFAQYTSECGLPIYAGEYHVVDEGEYVAVFYVEGKGYTGVYVTIHSANSIYDSTYSAFSKLKWWNDNPSEYEKFVKLSKLKRSLMSVKNRDCPAFEEIASYLDEEELYLSTYDLIEAVESGEENWPLVKSTISFFIARKDDVDTDWHELLPVVAPQGINAPELYEKIINIVKEQSKDIDSLIALSELAEDEAEKFAYITKSIQVANHFYDLKKISELEKDSKIGSLIIEKVESHITDEDFSSIGNPLDVLLALEKQSLLTKSFILNQVNSWIKAKKLPYTLSGIAESLYFLINNEISTDSGWDVDFLKELFDKYVNTYVSNVKSDDDVIECYEFLTEVIEDDKKAKQFREKHKAVLDAHESEIDEHETWNENINNICKCAVLVAAGDGSVSEEELDEIAKVKPFVNMFIKEKECVETLERTGDRDLSRAKRGEIFLMHEMVLFGQPTYVSEVVEDINNLESTDDYINLVKLYASKIEDIYSRRLTLWAAKEVAEIDGLDQGEKAVLNMFADAFDIDVQENTKYFQNIAFPAIDDDISISNSDDSSFFTEMDEIATTDGEDGEAARSIMEKLGLDSFEELAKLLSDDDDEKIVEDTDAPPIFEALFENNSWEDVLSAIERGVDVNAVMNFSGVENLQIITLCAQQGPTHVLKALIEAGANINARITNPEYATNYEDPLTAALSSDNNDNFRLLLDAGADPNAKKEGEPGTTPLLMSVRHYNWYAFKTLLDIGVDPNVTNTNGWNAIKIIANHKNKSSLKFMKELFKAGCNPNKPDEESYCSIHNAVREQQFTLVKFLIEKAKVPIDQKLSGMQSTIDFSTPIDIAVSTGNKTISDYLFENGASLTEGFNLSKSESLSTKNIYTAIFNGGLLNKNFDTEMWLTRVKSVGLKPNIHVVKELFLIAESELEDYKRPIKWAVNYVKDLMSQSDFTEDEFENVHTEINDYMKGFSGKPLKILDAMLEAFELYE